MKHSIYTMMLVIAMGSMTTAAADKAEITKRNQAVKHYAEIVYANYSDCFKTAEDLQLCIQAFIAQPSEDALKAAKEAWLIARRPYGQSEVFRFYSGPIDDEDGPEGQLNAWPLDESYIESDGALKGIINDIKKYPEITVELLKALNEKEGEENISTGYHAIEFLLWGLDTSATSPGNRAVTDYTSDIYAARRKQYLKAVSDLLVSDLRHLRGEWAPAEKNYRADFEALDSKKSVQHILNGIGMLSGFELARERVDVPLSSMSQEDEHSCFSDNTHNDIIFNALGVQNAFEGRYNGVHFNVEEGASVKDLFANGDELSKSINQSLKLAKGLGAPFDQLIIESNKEGRASVKAVVDSLSKQAKEISIASSAIGIQINIEE